jgi:hypothetical protein
MEGKTMRAETTIFVEIDDPSALHAWAQSDFLEGGNDEATCAEFLGTAERPNLSNCLRQMYDREIPEDAGVKVQDSHAEILSSDTVRLRSIPLVACSTSHLTKEEIAAIDAIFEVEVRGNTTRSYDDVKYNGMYMSPKDSGFYVRIPKGESLEKAYAEMTPEMRSIVEAAVAQGAQRIEFDADEAEVDGIDTHDHG